MPEGNEPQAVPPSDPATPDSGDEAQGRPEPTAAPGAFDRDQALASLPEGLRAGLLDAPTPVLQRAIEELGSGYIPKPAYTRKRQEETDELRQLRDKLTREAAQRETLERLFEQRGQATEPAEPAPSRDELGAKLLEVSDPREYMDLFEQAVDQRSAQRAQEIVNSHPLIRRLEAAAAADAARPTDMDPSIYRRGYDSLQETFRQRGIDPMAVDPQVVAFLTPYWAELEQNRTARSGNGAPTPQHAPQPGQPAATPVTSSPPTARTTTPDIDYAKAFGPESNLGDRVEATLRQLDMTPGDLARLRETQRSL